MLLKVRGFWSMSLLIITLFLAASSALAAGSATITTPANNSALPPSPDYNVTGTASGSGLTKVEVSFDRGGSWSTATGTTSWSYTWKAPIPLGSYSILSRATDSSGTGSPAPGTHVVVDGTAPSSSISSPPGSLSGTSYTIGPGRAHVVDYVGGVHSGP